MWTTECLLPGAARTVPRVGQNQPGKRTHTTLIMNDAAMTPATTFILWVLVGTAPPYERGTFPSYDCCLEAAYGQVETLKAIQPDVHWQCVPAGRR